MTDSKPERNSQPYEQVGVVVSIFKRGNIWWVNWQHAGRQQRKSLKTKSMKEARLRALRLETEILNGEYRKKVKAASIAEVISAYMQYLETERRKPKTLVKYRGIVKRLSQVAEDNDKSAVNQITISFLDKYRHARVTAGVSAKTIYNETIVIRQLVNFAKTRGLMSGDPLAGLKLSEPKPTPQPCFTRDEVEQILRASQEPQQSIYTVLADTGARIGEIKWLTWEDVDFKRNVLHIRSKDDWTPKTGDQRAIPMTDRVGKLLRSRQRKHRWVFTAAPSNMYPQGDHQISERRLLRSLKRLLKCLNIKGHLHTFRHAFISHALSTGVPEAVVRSIVGHVDEKIIRLYTHIADQRLQEAVRNLDGQPDGPAATTEADDTGRKTNAPADSMDSEKYDEDSTKSTD
jgi:site-specific recombinase XerD